MRRCSRGAAIILFFVLGVACNGQSQRTANESLKSFLQSYLASPQGRYIAAFVDLNGDGKKEAIVYLNGPDWCGTGGCTTLILHKEGFDYKVVTRVTIVQLPIRVLGGSTNGWRNLGVWVKGPGGAAGYEAELRFDGKSYPRNPTVPPARRINGVAGQVVIDASQRGTPLYP